MALPGGVEMDDVLRLFGNFLGELNVNGQAKSGKRGKGEGKRRRGGHGESGRAKRESNTKRIKRDTGKGKRNSKKSDRGIELEVINETPRDETEREDTEHNAKRSKTPKQKSNAESGSKKAKVSNATEADPNDIGKKSTHF